MGSVISYDEKCPQCKKEKGFSDFYYKNHEEYFYCQADKCGFSYTYLWKRDNEGNLITRDNTKNYKFENLIMVETVIKNGKKIITQLKQKKNYEKSSS